MVFSGPVAGEFDLSALGGKTAMRFGFIVFGVLVAATLLAQFGAPPARRIQAPARQPARQAAALESLKTFLNLSDAQVLQLKDLSDQHLASTRPVSTRLRSNQVALHQLMSSTAEPDAAKAGQLVIESRGLRAQLQASRQELAQKTTAVLTPEQQEKLATLPATVEAQRQASPGLMPESWPMLRAAAQLGLSVPMADTKDGGAPMRFRRGPAAEPLPAEQN